MSEKKAKQITNSSKCVAKMLIDSYDNLALMSGFYKDEEVTYVVKVNVNEDKSVSMFPLFIVVDTDMYLNCADCDGNKLN